MNKCDTCMYQHDIEFDACHICNNEQDMYRKKRTNVDKLHSMNVDEIEEWYWWMHKEMMNYTDSYRFVHEWFRKEV